jgi:hypothetical protein
VFGNQSLGIQPELWWQALADAGVHVPIPSTPASPGRRSWQSLPVVPVVPDEMEIMVRALEHGRTLLL